MIAYPTDAGRAVAVTLPAPVDEQLYVLGAAHRDCLHVAEALLRAGRAVLDDPLQELFVDAPPGGRVHTNWLPPPRGRCPFCQDLHPDPTKEDIYPIWLVKELRRLGARISSPDPRRRKIIWPTTPVCRHCNNTWMSALENDVSKILRPMFLHTRMVSEADQKRLALWAAMKVILFDAAGESVVPHGFGQSLNIFRQPHPDIRVWIGAYHDPDPLPLIIRPIYAESAGEAERLSGWCVTFAVVRVAFQVFIPFFEGNLAPLPDFLGSVVQVWPPTGLDLDWPPPYRFDKESLQALAARVNDNRTVIEMEVTLTKAAREPVPATDVDRSTEAVSPGALDPATEADRSCDHPDTNEREDRGHEG